ncbi:MAG TPA: polysaccharide biosynthesis/export family protein [Sphingomicrobium sp.]|nr:polysaccharide biosynthesis/export family protein [Sphingomicrobium sp.]
MSPSIAFSSRRLLCTAAVSSLVGCHSVSPTVTSGPAAIEVTGVANGATVPGAYRLGPADVVRVNVAYEPEASVDNATVDTSGEISIPLIGVVRAAGLTAPELAEAVRQRMTAFIRDPKVSVNVTRFARQTVTVEGSIVAPGIYDVQGTGSLLQTLALAKGPTNTAKLDEVIVFRTVNGQRMAAVFDLRRIRRGFDPDPLILGGDTVVVGYSQLKGAFRDFLSAAPAIAVFRPY